MLEPQLLSLLERKDRWIVLSTVGPDGFPHAVPIGYFFFENRILMGCRDNTQKVRNIERNPKVSLLWENGRGEDDLIGVMFQGHARVVRNSDERLAIRREACRQRGEKPPESPPAPGSVYIEVSPSKTISWNRPTRAQRLSAPSTKNSAI